MRRSATREIRLRELDLTHAPAPQVVPQEKQRKYNRLKSALEQYWKGMRPREILRLYGVSKQLLSYYQNRFFLAHKDGRIQGFRALIGNVHINLYERKMVSDSASIQDGFGAAGSFQQCLKKYPTARKAIDDAINQSEKNRFSHALAHAEIHQKFLTALRADGVTATQYPFCTKLQGYESLRKYVLEAVRVKKKSGARTALFGHEALDGLDGMSNEHSWLSPLLPCDIACYDEQTLPAIGVVALEHEGQRILLPMERMSLCMLVSMKPKCILAYHLSLRSRVSSGDFLETFSNLLTPWTPWKFEAVPTLAYKSEAGLPSGVVPGFLENLRLGLVRIDNDLTHYADAVLVYLKHLLGLQIEFGKVRRWITRYVVEQVFGELQVLLSRLPSTTGSGPHDRHVNDAAGNAVKWEITLDQLKDLIEVVVANFNAKPRTELYGATPLEAVKREFSGRIERGSAIPGYSHRSLKDLPLPVDICKVTIRGSEKKGTPPYVEMDHAKYSSALLRDAWQLIGTPCIALLQKDHRVIKLCREDGEELGAVQVTGHWSDSFHNRATRKEIIRLRNAGLLKYRQTDDPVEAFREFKIEEMAKHVREKPEKVMRGSNRYLDTLRGRPDDGGATPVPRRARSDSLPDASGGRWTDVRIAVKEAKR